MKHRLKLKMNLSKFDMDRVFEGKAGKYLDFTLLVDPEADLDRYNNHGFIAHTQSQAEREAKSYAPIVGNFEITWKEGQEKRAFEAKEDLKKITETKPETKPETKTEGWINDDIPF